MSTWDSTFATWGLLVLTVLIWLLLYAYISYCLQVMGNKLGLAHTLMAWVPVLNLYYLCKLADRPAWWLILLFIPFVNIVVPVILFWAVARRLGKPGWLSLIIVFIPFLNLAALGYLAFSDSSPAAAA